jgi:hypothetical protein
MKRALFWLWSAQGLLAAGWLALLPGDAERGLLFGLSAARLGLLAGILALSGFSAWLAWHPAFNLPPRWIAPLYRSAIFMMVAAPLLILVLNGLGKTSGFIFSAAAARLVPLAFWLALCAFELIFTLAPRLASRAQTAAALQSVLKPTLYTLLVLALLVLFLTLTRLGLTRYNDGSWGAPATPVLEWQIALALAASLGFVALQASRRWPWLVSQKDRFIALFIYLLTCLAWLAQPLVPGYFATAPRAPNFEIYPFSDALIYSQYAQSALVGNGFMWPDVPTRPLYIAFITWLHALAGQDYSRVILLQTLVLALFPVVLYFLGKQLAGRPLGVGLALLALLRDLTANISAPFTLNNTNSKLFFSEIPTALLLSLFTLMILRWMKAPKPAWYPLLAGGLLGLSALIRLQSAVLLLAVVPLAFFIIKNPRRWFVGCAMLALGLGLALTPWLLRNRAATGGLLLDNPISQTMVLARRWGGDNGNALIPRLPGEGDAAYSSRMTGLALASLRANPGRILGSAVNHFFNNEIGNLLVFPLRDQLDSPSDLLWPSRAFWQSWNGQPAPGQLPVIALYLALFGLGLASAWRLNGLAGLLPLALSLVYNAWTALFLSSGDRFLVPVDWAVYFYHFLGLFTLASLALGWIIPAVEAPPGRPASPARSFAWRNTVFCALLILFAGASIPLTELAFPKRYPAAAADLTPGTALSLRGRAIYPRWYAAGDGEPGSAKLGYGITGAPRLVFYLVGQKNSLVIFPLKKTPGFFPNAADVTIRATQRDGYIQAEEIVVEKDGRIVKYVP